MIGTLKILRFRESRFALLKEGLCAEIVMLLPVSINQNALSMLMGNFFSKMMVS